MPAQLTPFSIHWWVALPSCAGVTLVLVPHRLAAHGLWTA